MNTVILPVIPPSAHPAKYLRASRGFLLVVALLLLALSGGAHAGLDKSMAKRPILDQELKDAQREDSAALSDLKSAIRDSGLTRSDAERLINKYLSGQDVGIKDLPPNVKLPSLLRIKEAYDRLKNANKHLEKVNKAIAKNERQIQESIQKQKNLAGSKYCPPTNGSKGNMSQNAKGMAQNSAKGAAQNSAKNSAKDTAKNMAKDTGKNAGKDTAKNMASDTGKNAGKNAAKNAAKTTAMH